MFKFAALNDRTKGFRFKVLGQQGLVRIRKHKSRGWFKVELGKNECMVMMHFGKATVYWEAEWPARLLYRFANA